MNKFCEFICFFRCDSNKYSIDYILSLSKLKSKRKSSVKYNSDTSDDEINMEDDNQNDLSDTEDLSVKNKKTNGIKLK